MENSQFFENPNTSKTTLEFEISAHCKIELDSSGNETYHYNLEEIDRQIQRIIDNYGGKCDIRIKVSDLTF